jgi:aspartyl-tRNA(Asn)/glutamyl-tRNA(Gln) amidotransferase subunit A
MATPMLEKQSPLTQLATSLANGDTTPLKVAHEVARCANGNASHNTYIHFDQAQLMRQAERLQADHSEVSSRPPLFSVPISLKDCFDLAGTCTTCGSHFYAEHHPPATRDSAMASRLRASGALITGKTHLHALAYGITGENPDYGDCVQPRDAALLTGGSSSGAAASVQEGSALAAIGTDTGGSTRVPAALCGLVGYRSSLSLASPSGGWPEAWEGGAHLAASFDAVGFLLRDPRDAGPIASALFNVPITAAPVRPRIGCAPLSLIDDCEPQVLAAYRAWQAQLAHAGATIEEFDSSGFEGLQDVFAGIQAHEAAALHRGHYDQFEPAITQRLNWGASLTDDDLAPLRQRLVEFRGTMGALLERFDFLVLPAAPVSRLFAGQDHSAVRARILRYTAPFSLASLPAISLPGEIIGAPFGTGVQIAAAPGSDGALLAFVAALGSRIASRAS